MKKFQYGVWYPIKDYYENINDLDWAIVQFKETKTGFLPLPYRAEYHQRDKIWFTDTDADRYLCELCEPIAFMLWQPIEEVLKKDGGRMNGLEALNKIDNEVLYGVYAQEHYSNELAIIRKELKALEVIKRFTWIEDGKLKCGRYAYIEIELEEEDFENKEEFNLLKEVLE